MSSHFPKNKNCLRELIVPVSLLGAVAALILPLPGPLLDFLLVAQVLLALLLLGSALYIPDPISLSALPSMLLLTTLYRLALNVSTTRLILGSGEAGRVIEAFGSVVISGSLVVGCCVFLIITLIQYVVIAKGSERVAEVSARFTLDALPGKQMSIDADLRSGIIDPNAARKLRQDLQIESRFYGALDGAMKFVKGDAIAGLVITAVNVIGGLAVGLVLHQLDWSTALSKYTLLTVGDGLLSQLPAVLNSLAAGMIVTRVSRGNNHSLASELFIQLSETRKAQFLVAFAALSMALMPGLPFLPFALAGALLLGFAAMASKNEDQISANDREVFRPRMPALLEIHLGRALVKQVFEREDASSAVKDFQERIYTAYGLIMPQPDFKALDDAPNGYQIYIRGVCSSTSVDCGSAEGIMEEVLRASEKLIELQPADFVDDIMTRRILDYFESFAPELSASIIPDLVTVTQLTEILKALVEERISVRNFDLILQAVAEYKPKLEDGRRLVEEVRIALKRLISQKYSERGQLVVITLDPLLDIAFARAEREGESLSMENLKLLLSSIREHVDSGGVLLSSKGARRLLRDCLTMHGIDLPVIAHEEVTTGTTLVEAGRVELRNQEQRTDLITALAA